MVRDLFTHEPEVRGEELVGFAQDWVEWLLFPALDAAVLSNGEGSDVGKTYE